MPGRKSLVWISDRPGGPGSQFLGPANTHLYPVLVRGLGSSGVFAWMRDTREMGAMAARAGMASGTEFAQRHALEAIAAASGGSGFTDSLDIGRAVHTAIEDASNAYVLGFYPQADTLDNKFHAVAVEVTKQVAAHGRKVELHYRPGYFASRNFNQNAAGRPLTASSVDAVFRNPLDATAIGLAAVPEFSDGKYQVTVTVDLNDIHFDMVNSRHEGSLTVSVADDGTGQVDESDEIEFHGR